MRKLAIAMTALMVLVLAPVGYSARCSIFRCPPKPDTGCVGYSGTQLCKPAKLPDGHR